MQVPDAPAFTVFFVSNKNGPKAFKTSFRAKFIRNSNVAITPPDTEMGQVRFLTDSKGVTLLGSVEVGRRLHKYCRVRTASNQKDIGSPEPARSVLVSPFL
jgi:hypothetical protein